MVHKTIEKSYRPNLVEVKRYLDKWQTLENYRLQEDALNKLFVELCPKNDNISDILLKVAALNDFYSTNIYSVFSVAQRIIELDIDKRLDEEDVNLVNEIKKVMISGKEKHFYSFASKYCSHHRPESYPIYDSYVDQVLSYFRNRDKFYKFKNGDLKEYSAFKRVLAEFQKFYDLQQFSLKEIDRYLWLFGKEYFPKQYK
jgi:hypothetical protein